MKQSTERFLTTHCGSLARPADLLEMMHAKERGQPYDEKAFPISVRTAVADVVRRQVETGVDVVCDGEQGKASFLTYVRERLTGFELKQAGPAEGAWTDSREVLAFPEFYAWNAQTLSGTVTASGNLVCTGPIFFDGKAT